MIKERLCIMNTVKIGNFEMGAGNPLVLMAGPCVLEDYERCLFIGRTIRDITSRLGIPYIFKASFDKANRSSFHGFRGPGLEKGLEMLANIKKELGVPVVTDIHTELQPEPVSKVVDVLQIPAFLCRQTDLLNAAAKTGAVVNVKKGQFMAPKDMRNVVDKILEGGNSNIILTERGASFGYNNLVVDMRSFPIMRSFGYPVVFDATHSVQLPGGSGTSSGGNRELAEYLARAAVGAGVDGLFMEVHDNPEEALCDGPNSIYLDKLEDILKDCLSIYNIVRKKLY
jgi:2-dehydro-3-deoxyphosphooctonate aldolase (KDO 8-P synthase)